MDNADLSEHQQDIIHRANLRKSRREQVRAEANGECLNCAEPVAEGRRWCNADCRDDWQSEQERGG